MTFEYKASRRWRYLFGLSTVSLPGLTGMVLAVTNGYVEAIPVVALVVGVPVVYLFRRMWLTAEKAELADEYLEVSTFGGRKVRMEWSELGKLIPMREMPPANTKQSSNVVLMTQDNKKRIVLNSQMEGFDRLMEQIQNNARQLKRMPPTIWDHMQWG